MRISVFGGSSPQPGDPIYQEALKLGGLLGQAGHTVMTGGYMGTMEAVSRGAAESGGIAVGVTCDEIEAWRNAAPNPYLTEELRFPTLRERLFTLVEECDAAIALPGGVGTLTEIALTWNFLQTEALPPITLILLGPGWKKMTETFFTEFDAFISTESRSLVHFAPDAETAVQILNRYPAED
jgi:uncharacterized protein (TIGR00730 family)